MYTLPVLVTSCVTFDTASDRLVFGEEAIVTSIERHGIWWIWTMMSIDKPRVIVQLFGQCPRSVFKNWLRPVA